MPVIFNPTAEETRVLEALIARSRASRTSSSPTTVN